MRGITKTFGAVVANHKVDLDIRQGEILSLLGENGSGKTTLMNMLSGIYFPDEGEIAVNGPPVTIRSPKDAFDLGIGMVHQHFKLVDVFTAAENVALGLKNEGRLDLKAVSGRIREICAKYGFQVDPDQKIYDMSVSQKQNGGDHQGPLPRGRHPQSWMSPPPSSHPRRPTAFRRVRNMKADGKSVVIITHSSTRSWPSPTGWQCCARGVHRRCGHPGHRSPEAHRHDGGPGGHPELRAAGSGEAEPPPGGPARLRPVRRGGQGLDDVSFEAYGGEILGIAGISGTRAEGAAGRPSLGSRASRAAGHILYHPPAPDEAIAGSTLPVDRAGEELIGKDPLQIKKIGVSLAFVPEGPAGHGPGGGHGHAGQ
jgi:simple sugar transport system ATP-binding protein